MDTGQLLNILMNVIKVLKYVIPVLCFILIVAHKWGEDLTEEQKKQKEKEKEEREAESLVNQKNSKIYEYFDYDRIDDKLRRYGVYRMYEKLNPSTWLTIKFGIAFIFLLCGISLGNAFVGLILAVVGFIVPELLIKMNNETDNENMLDDIKNIFDTLKIQTKAGVHISHSLCECYLIVEHPRLKAELLNMTNRIITTNNIEDAVKLLEKQFDNQYINTLCITILQSMESGKSSQTLEDLSKQIADMQRAINIKLEEALDRKVQMMQMGLFLVLIIACIYVLTVSVATSFINF